jgi:hypothetical protein
MYFAACVYGNREAIPDGSGPGGRLDTGLRARVAPA